jgi:hypothetical protein
MLRQADQARSTLSGWLQAIVVTERRDLDPDLSHCRQNRRPRLTFNGVVIDDDA